MDSKRKVIMKRAWIITKQSFSKDQYKSEEVVTIRNLKSSEATIRRLLEEVNLDHGGYDLVYRIGVARGIIKQQEAISTGNIGQFTCGDDPMFVARIVENLQVRCDMKGNDIFEWDEIPRKSVEDLKRERGIIK